MTQPSKLRFSDLHKRFGRRSVLKGVDLSLYGGQCVLLAGVNGAGKSTLLRILAGLEKPDQGQLDCGLGPTNWRRCRRILQDRVLYMHQQPYLFDGSVRRNLAYALPRNLARMERERRIAEAASWAKLEAITEMPAHTLSGGERQRIALARAFFKDAPLWLLDDPISQVDSETGSHIIAAIRAQAGKRTLIIVSHRLSAVSFADHIITLDKGRVIESGNHQGLIEKGGYYCRAYGLQEIVDEI